MFARPGPTVLQTERLILRPRRPDEVDVYRRMWAERDPRVPAHRRIDVDGRPTREDLMAELRREAGEPRPWILAIELRTTGDAVGYCGLVPHRQDAADETELVYELLRRAHGHGYATEAGAAVLAQARAAGYGQVWATVRRWNTASQRVAAKLNFEETGEVEIDPVHGDSILLVCALPPTSDSRPPACLRLTDALDPAVTSTDVFASGQAGLPEGEDGQVIWCGDPDLLLARDPVLGELALAGQTRQPGWCIDLTADVSDGRLASIEVDGNVLDVLLDQAGHAEDAAIAASAIGLPVEDAARVLAPVLRRVVGA